MSTVAEHIIDPPLPTWKRYRALFCKEKNLSIPRSLQYELISQKIFKGKTLDFGGGDKAIYRALLQCEDYESVNIDPAMEPTWITQVGDTLPCPADTYDHAISLNTLEHVYEPKPIVKDIYKALKKGGLFTCGTPFLHPVHAHPDDFFRPTASWWFQTLTETGFTDIRIQPILWGPFSTGIVCSSVPGPFKKLRIHFNLLLDWFYTKLLFRKGETRFEGPSGRQTQDHALAYLIEAQK